MPNTALAGFLQVAAGRRFEWGQFDCGLWLADWVRQARGLSFDPAEALRGQYSAGRSALRAMGHSGFGSTVDGIAARCGLERTTDPVRGDIAIVRPDGSKRLTGAIRGAKGWVLLTETMPGQPGISLCPDHAAAALAIWRV